MKDPKVGKGQEENVSLRTRELILPFLDSQFTDTQCVYVRAHSTAVFFLTYLCFTHKHQGVKMETSILHFEGDHHV